MYVGIGTQVLSLKRTFYINQLRVAKIIQDRYKIYESENKIIARKVLKISCSVVLAGIGKKRVPGS